MPYKYIVVEEKPPVAIVRLNRPEAGNAISTQLVRELVRVFERLEIKASIKSIVLTGTDKFFSYGADIKEFLKVTPASLIARRRTLLWDRIRRIQTPIIGAVSGLVLGGGWELIAASCDHVVASETARFGHPEIKLGIIPGEGGTQWLTRLVGRLVANEIILLNREIDARRALELRAVNEVHPIETYLDVAVERALEYAALPHNALRIAGEAIDMAFETTLKGGLMIEQYGFALTSITEDSAEGAKAFVEKRKPKFRGR